MYMYMYVYLYIYIYIFMHFYVFVYVYITGTYCGIVMFGLLGFASGVLSLAHL